MRDAVDGVERLVAIVADDDAFAGGQAVGLDDDRRVVAIVEIGRGGAGIAKDAVVGGRDVGVAQQVLAEDLARFQLGGGLRRAERLQAGLRERVDDAGGERRFGADDREVDLVLLREVEQALDVGRGDVDVLGVLSGAGVAGRDEHAIGAAALADFPGQRVFAATIANNENFHRAMRNCRERSARRRKRVESTKGGLRDVSSFGACVKASIVVEDAMCVTSAKTLHCELVVVVQRRHEEDALAAGRLERDHLHDHGQGLDDEDAAHDHEHDSFLVTITAIVPSAAAQRERADVAHEHLGRVGVEPEEAEPGADQRAAEDRHLAGARDVRDAAGASRRPVPGDVGDDREGAPAIMHRGAIARPSSPSVRFTALLVPTMHEVSANTTKPVTPERRRCRLEERDDQLGLGRPRCAVLASRSERGAADHRLQSSFAPEEPAADARA